MTQPGVLIQQAQARHLCLATAESCTAGMVAEALTDVAGASAIYDCGLITYSNAAKQRLLGVRAETLARFGAVSTAVAREMAQGLEARCPADIALAVTGVAGPGGSQHKPEGCVCFAVATRQGCFAETVHFGPLGRRAVRRAACDYALWLLHKAVVDF